MIGSWTNFTRSPDTRIIFVSSSIGSDANDGLSEQTPVRTLARGTSLLRDNHPDWLRLKKGDVWYESFGPLSRQGDGALSGRSPEEPMVFGYYGKGPRPVLKIGAGQGISPWSTENNASSYIAIVGLHFYAHTRDPNSHDFSGAEGGQGVRSISVGENILIEDCRFDFCGIIFDPFQRDNPNPRFSNVRIRRSVIYGNYADTGHAQGIFLNNTDGILLEENVLDHNGWNEQAGAERTKFNHNVYVTTYCTDLTAIGNIFARGSSSGLQARAGGIVNNNLFVGNATQLNFGWYSGDAVPPQDGVTGTVSGNVIMDGDPIDPEGINGDDALWGIQVGNIRSAVIENNLVILSGEITLSAKNIDGWVGINNLEMKNNRVIADDSYALQIINTAFSNVNINNNLLYGELGSIRDRDGGSQYINFENNVDTITDEDIIQTIGYYHGQIWRVTTLEAFLAQARNQERRNWKREYVGSWASNWLRKR